MSQGTNPLGADAPGTSTKGVLRVWGDLTCKIEIRLLWHFTRHHTLTRILRQDCFELTRPKAAFSSTS